MLSMKLVIFNGSPRYKKSNSKILIEHFLKGYNTINPDPVPVHYLANQKQKDEQKKGFQNSEIVIVVFPLYTDCMPGIVKEFLEGIVEMKLNSSKKIGFIVQSGFPEAIHSIYVERYLEKFTKRIQCEYLGTIIKGAIEGIQIMPPAMTNKLFGRFESLGEYFAKHEEFSPEINKIFRKPYKMSPLRAFLVKLISKTGLTNFYWNNNLKKNNAFHKRFDKPFEKANYRAQNSV